MEMTPGGRVGEGVWAKSARQTGSFMWHIMCDATIFGCDVVRTREKERERVYIVVSPFAQWGCSEGECGGYSMVQTALLM